MRRPPQLVSCHTLYNHGTAFLTVFSRQMLEIIFHFSETYEITLLYIYSWPPDIASFFHLYSLCGLSLKKKKTTKKKTNICLLLLHSLYQCSLVPFIKPSLYPLIILTEMLLLLC